MKSSWIVISAGVSILSFVVSYLFVQDVKISLACAVVVLVILVLSDPKRRYMKAFWGVLSLFLVLNRFFFEVVGATADIQYKLASPQNDTILSVLLLILAIVCLLLDYKERNPESNLLGTLMITSKKGNKPKQNIVNKGRVKKQVNIGKNSGKIEL